MSWHYRNKYVYNLLSPLNGSFVLFCIVYFLKKLINSYISLQPSWISNHRNLLTYARFNSKKTYHILLSKYSVLLFMMYCLLKQKTSDQNKLMSLHIFENSHKIQLASFVVY